MVVKKRTTKLEGAADVSKPEPNREAIEDVARMAQEAYDEGERLQAQADAGAAEAGVPPYSEPEPTSYVYIGGLDAVVAVVDGTAYDFRRGDPVHFGHPQPALDDHPDFKRVEAGA